MSGFLLGGKVQSFLETFRAFDSESFSRLWMRTFRWISVSTAFKFKSFVITFAIEIQFDSISIFVCFLRDVSEDGEEKFNFDKLRSKSTTFERFQLNCHWVSSNFLLSNLFPLSQISMSLSKVYVEDGLGIDLNVALFKQSGGSFRDFQNYLRISENCKFFVSTAKHFEKKPWQIRQIGNKTFGKDIVHKAKQVTGSQFRNLDFARAMGRVERSKGRQSVSVRNAQHDFLDQLSDEYPLELCSPRVQNYRRNFEATKDDLVAELTSLYNERVFGGKLNRVQVVWNNRITRYWGYDVDDVEGSERISRITLAKKNCTKPCHVRDILLHELCHSAVWIINGIDEMHGPVWTFWTEIAMRTFPNLPFLSVTV